jgi:choline dehydrogenase-like flavoprotein
MDNWIWFHIPVGYLFSIGNPRSDWMFKTEPEEGLNGRSLNYPRGKVIGGSSAINAMIYMRGQAADYDHWRQLGLAGWGWNDVLPFFRRHEDHFLGARWRAAARRSPNMGTSATWWFGGRRRVRRMSRERQRQAPSSDFAPAGHGGGRPGHPSSPTGSGAETADLGI